MNNILDLFKGIGVIIDDALHTQSENHDDIIWAIKDSFEKQNIPILTFSELPSKGQVQNFNTVSFILLDWDLCGQLPVGVSKPQTAADDNIEFIKQLNSVCFAPIFIFSYETTNNIKHKLATANLYDSTKNNHIFVESKNDLSDTHSLLTKLEEWMKNTASVYVLKEWENSLNNAKRNLFWDFYRINPEWVKVLYKTISKDCGDLSYEMNDILFENLKTRIFPIEFDTTILSTTEPNAVTSNEIRQVLEGQRFRKPTENMIFTGDIFLKNSKYYINVRPQCDCIPREDKQTIDDIELYLIEGEEKTDFSKLHFNKKYGTFDDIEARFTIFPICGNKAIQFELGKFSLKKYSEVKESLIGTLLPPFITRLIQKYALYMQRQGLPRIPEEAVQNDKVSK